MLVDTLLSMKVFRQIVESGSFVGAAERLNLSTAMTSKHLMHLEKHLRTRLLNRSSRSLSLTESGKLFFERCKVILEDVEEAESAVGSVRQSWLLKGPNGDIEVPARVVLRFGSMTVALAHAVCTGIGLAPLPRILFEDPMFRDALCPVLTEHPVRSPDLYAIYVSRNHLPLKIRTFVDHLFEYNQIPRPWDAETA